MFNRLKCLTLSTILLFSISFFGTTARATQGIEVEVSFSGNFGTTITDETGTYFNINYNSYYEYLYNYDPWGGWQYWYTAFEPKIYDSEYRFGQRSFDFHSNLTAEDALNHQDAGVPMYFFGTEAKILVAVTNNGHQAKAKVRITSEAFVLNTDGSNGQSYGNLKTQDLIIPKGATAYLNANFKPEHSAGIESGLDRFLVTVSHPNNSKDNFNRNGGNRLIGTFEAIFCPPETTNSLLGISQVSD